MENVQDRMSHLDQQIMYANTHSAFSTPTINQNSSAKMSNDDYSSLATDVSKNEKLQMEIALRNSMKDVYAPPNQTAEGDSISDLRTKRRLFQSSDQISLSQKRAAYAMKRTTLDSPISLTSSPSTEPVPQKLSNRLYNNKLDAAYFMATQTDDDVDGPVTAETIKVDPKWDQQIRIEVLRLLQNGKSEDKTAITMLYRILTRQLPRDKHNDMKSVASDCNHAGMSVEMTVEIMMSMV